MKWEIIISLFGCPLFQQTELWIVHIISVHKSFLYKTFPHTVYHEALEYWLVRLSDKVDFSSLCSEKPYCKIKIIVTFILAQAHMGTWLSPHGDGEDGQTPGILVR